MNIYYDPEKFGLKILGEVELAGGYSFDKFVVWQHLIGPDNLFGWAKDAGCSCPTPFSEVGILDLKWGQSPACDDALRNWYAEERYGAGDSTDITALSAKIWNAVGP